jgi:type II secretory pathway pseudopilin PulG
MVLPRHDRVRRPRPTRGFTLVELITAASLMTLMMMGVVQIFAIVTETAAQAQGNAFALEQGRALMDAIHRDIRGFDRMGYLKIQYSDTKETGLPVSDPAAPVVKYFTPQPPLTRPPTGIPIFNGEYETNGNSSAIKWYSTDCLALSTIGYHEGQWPDILKNSTAAEVVYTANVLTPTSRLVLGSEPTDPRRGLVSRGVWLISPTTISAGQTITGSTQDSEDISRALVLTDLESGAASVYDRIEGTGKRKSAASVSFLTVFPSTSVNPIPTNYPWQVRRVATSCTSEFLVEFLDPTVSQAQWTRNNWSVTPTNTSTTTPVECPRAIRVTVAIHDPDDRRPATGASKRFEGFTLQETFWISDP